MTTEIQNSAAEAKGLWTDITRADETLNHLRAASETESAKQRRLETDIQLLEEFCDKASDRKMQIEEYILTLRPKCPADAIVLLSLALEMAADLDQSRISAGVRDRRLPRILAEVIAFLEGEGSVSADDLGIGAPLGIKGQTWQSDVERVRSVVGRGTSIA